MNKSHYEHNELSATACPSGRFTAIWDTIIAALKEDDMPAMYFVRATGVTAIWATNWQTKWHVPNTTTLREVAKASGVPVDSAGNPSIITASSRVVNSIPTAPRGEQSFHANMTKQGGRIRQWAAEGATKVVGPHEEQMIKSLQVSVQAILDAIKAGDAVDAEAIANELAERLRE